MAQKSNEDPEEEERTSEWRENISKLLLRAKCRTRKELVEFLLGQIYDIRSEMGLRLG